MSNHIENLSDIVFDDTVEITNALKESLQVRGVAVPILVDNKKVLNGHKRIKAFIELRKEGKVRVSKIPATFFRSDGPPVSGYIELEPEECPTNPIPSP